MASLCVVNEFVLILPECKHTKDQEAQTQHCAVQPGVCFRDGVVEHDPADKIQKPVHGVELEQHQERRTVNNGNIVHDGGQVSPQGNNDTVNIEHVSQEDRNRCQDHAEAQSKHQKAQIYIGEHDVVPGHSRAGEDQNQIKRDLTEQEVDAHKETFGNGENVLGHIYLVDQTEVGHHTAHGKVGCLAEVVEGNQAAHQISQIVNARRGEFKNIGEHQRHDRHGEHGVQKTPQNTQHTAFIFYLKVPGNQLLQQKAVPVPNIFQVVIQSICLQVLFIFAD